MSDLVNRSQTERLTIAGSLLASVWQEYINGSIEGDNLQLAVYIQTDINRIVWKLNALMNEDLQKGGSDEQAN